MINNFSDINTGNNTYFSSNESDSTQQSQQKVKKSSPTKRVFDQINLGELDKEIVELDLKRKKITHGLELAPNIENPQLEEKKDTNTDYYEGEIKEGLPHGNGTYKFVDGTKYVGSFVDGFFHGWGRIMESDGSTYEGDFKKDLYDGEGILKRVDGSTYTGTFSQGLASGLGKIFFSNGKTLTADFKAGICVEGTLETENQEVYTGSLKDDQPHGSGKLELANGSIYTGMFEKGLPHGYGTLFDVPHKYSYEGNFFEKNKQGKGKISYSDGSVYEGNFKYDDFFGHGKWQALNGQSYEGNFSNGLRSGHGKFCSIRREMGYRYIGEFKAGQMHGKGELIKANTVFKGTFKKGKEAEGEKWTFDLKNCVWKGMSVRYKLVNGILNNEYEVLKDTIYAGKSIKIHPNQEPFDENFNDNFEVIYGIDGSFYKGSIVEGKKHGKGEMHYPSGILYKGDFQNDLFHGEGKLESLQVKPLIKNNASQELMNMRNFETQSYEGGFVNGLPHGKGVFFGIDYKYEGEFEKGQMHGKGTLTKLVGLDSVAKVSKVLFEEGKHNEEDSYEFDRHSLQWNLKKALSKTQER